MSGPPRICVLIPVYNHGLTVQRVAREARAALPVIVVNDGSTDQTAAVLAEVDDIVVITLPQNLGKAAALKEGFVRAEALGFTHTITMDADGQHAPTALPEFVAACRLQPDAFIIGVRELKEAGAPLARRASNALSNFWFRFETGQRLADTQCGYRGYPLAAIRQLRLASGRYAWELEVLVKAAWAGFPIVAQPVTADYAAPTSRMSHFHPWRDLVAIAWLHARLATRAFCVPALLRKWSALGLLQQMPPGRRFRTVLRHLFS